MIIRLHLDFEALPLNRCALIGLTIWHDENIHVAGQIFAKLAKEHFRSNQRIVGQ
jgi:hypothetical protein